MAGECYKEGKGSVHEGAVERCEEKEREGGEEEVVDGEEEEEEEKGEGGKRGSGEEFMKEVMEAVRLRRQPTPWMLHREKLVRMMKREMERGIARPGSFVAESLHYNQNLARAYLRFGVQSCPPKEELAIRENRMMRRKMMMLSHEE